MITLERLAKGERRGYTGWNGKPRTALVWQVYAVVSDGEYIGIVRRDLHDHIRMLSGIELYYCIPAWSAITTDGRISGGMPSRKSAVRLLISEERTRRAAAKAALATVQTAAG
jgi:uncharacterized protein involved in tellurium resistance